MFDDRLDEEDEDGTVIVDEPDQETIEAAIYALTEIDDLRALKPIIQRISDECYIQGETLRPWGEPALRLLIETLKSDDENRRGIAASLLGGFGDTGAVPALIEVLQNDKSDRVRRSAVYALGLNLLQDPSACDALIVALHDPHELVRTYAEWGLDRLRELGTCT